MLVEVSAWIVVVWHEGKCPPRENVLAAVASMLGHDAHADTVVIPDGVVTLGILHPSSVALLRDVTVYGFHEYIGSQHAMHKVPPDVEVVKIVLKQGQDLAHKRSP
jgi:hypothetical protein